MLTIIARVSPSADWVTLASVDPHTGSVEGAPRGTVKALLSALA